VDGENAAAGRAVPSNNSPSPHNDRHFVSDTAAEGVDINWYSSLYFEECVTVGASNAGVQLSSIEDASPDEIRSSAFAAFCISQ
jgi:hypothetical protein